MTPQIRITEQEKETLEETHLQEQFIRQVDDHSLPAKQVLTDQQEERAPSDLPALFVP